MATGDARTPPRWLWNGVLGLITLVLGGALVLIVALALGWNSPRPARAPDWEAPGLPTTLRAAPDETVVSALDHPGDDFTLEVTAAAAGSEFNAYGLVYRLQDARHYYAFAVGSDGYHAVLRVNGGEEVALLDWQQFPHIHRGREANRLRVACEGRTCHYYINDEYAATVGDDTWLAGDVGLWVRGFTGEVSVAFERASMWAEQAPNQSE